MMKTNSKLIDYLDGDKVAVSPEYMKGYMNQPVQQSSDLPELQSHDHPDVIGGFVWTEMEMRAIRDYARAAIAATQVVADQPISSSNNVWRVIDGWRGYAFSVERDDANADLQKCLTDIQAALSEESKVRESIQFTSVEISSGLDRVRWAEGLIRQLPENHDGRNSWLLNYGVASNAGKASSEQIAKSIKYPDDWDTAAYPTIESALIEIYAWFSIRSSEPAVAAIEAVQWPDAPKHIYLVIEDGNGANQFASFNAAQRSANMGDGLMWCEDHQGVSDIKYVRADLASTPAITPEK